ncbi:MAG: helix-turn-helix domain-containing protein [Thermoguttaceae bacterium]|jgi:excisionase family DNA binding protein
MIAKAASSNAWQKLDQPKETAPVRLLLRPQEAANALGVSLRTLMSWVEKGQVPFVRLGTKNLRFNFKELQIWVDANTIGRVEKSTDTFNTTTP